MKTVTKSDGMGRVTFQVFLESLETFDLDYLSHKLSGLHSSSPVPTGPTYQRSSSTHGSLLGVGGGPCSSWEGGTSGIRGVKSAHHKGPARGQSQGQVPQRGRV